MSASHRPSEKEIVVNELHKPARKIFPRRRVIVKGLNDLFQADLIEMIPYARQNGGFKYILTVIDCFSKYAWAVPLKTKSAKNVVVAMEKILRERQPKNMQTDNGTEFYNKDFNLLMKKHSVNHYSVFSTKKACIVERFIRTIKSMMYKHFSLHGNYKWLKVLPILIDKYNNQYHRTIKMKPAKVNVGNEQEILHTSYNHIKMIDKQKFKVGDAVRISKFRTIFTRGFHPSWTPEIFRIREVKLTNPTTYLLRDIKNQNVDGCFYSQELQKVHNEDVYLIEKVLRKKKNLAYIKWYGYDSSYNSWINAKDILS